MQLGAASAPYTHPPFCSAHKSSVAAWLPPSRPPARPPARLLHPTHTKAPTAPSVLTSTQLPRTCPSVTLPVHAVETSSTSPRSGGNPHASYSTAFFVNKPLGSHMADKSIQGTPSPSPPPCAKGCGFFGSPSTMNMCSKCFRDHQRSNNQVAQEPSTPQTQVPAPAESSVPPSASFSPAILRPVPVTHSPAQAAPTVAEPVLAIIHPSEVQKPDVDMVTASGEDPTAPPPRKVQKNTSRCFSCRKKIGLTGFKCHCGYFYCSEHRYSDKHECDFDYQASAREQLEKANPVVVASKLDKI